MSCTTFIEKGKKYTCLTSCNCRWSWSSPSSEYTFSAKNSDADSGSHGTRRSWRSVYGKTGSWTFNNRKVKRFSAESVIVESKFLQISFTYATNRSGPNTLPCVTPGVTLTFSDNYIPVHNQTFMHCKFAFRLQHTEHNALPIGSCFHGRSNFISERGVLCRVVVQRRKFLWTLIIFFKC